MILEIFGGLILALILAYIGRYYFPRNHYKIWSKGLIIAALIYVFFALWGQNYQWLSIEVLGVLLYAIPAVLSMKYSKNWLALGWALHVLWDILLHAGEQTSFVPGWYPGVCLGFDLGIAGFILWSIRKSKAENLVQVEG